MRPRSRHRCRRRTSLGAWPSGARPSIFQPPSARPAPPGGRDVHSIVSLEGAIQRLVRSAKAASMSRMLVLIVVVVVVLGALFFLSTLPKERPTHQIEVAVPQGGN